MAVISVPRGCGRSCCPLIGPWCLGEGAMMLTCAFLLTPCVQDHADCVLVGPDKPGHVTIMLMLSPFFLVEIIFCTYISCWGRHFFVWGCPARPSLFFKNQTFFLFGSPCREKRPKTKQTFSYRSRKERNQTEWRAHSVPVATCKFYSKVRLWWGVLDGRRTRLGGGNTVIYGGNTVVVME